MTTWPNKYTSGLYIRDEVKHWVDLPVFGKTQQLHTQSAVLKERILTQAKLAQAYPKYPVLGL